MFLSVLICRYNWRIHGYKTSLMIMYILQTRLAELGDSVLHPGLISTSTGRAITGTSSVQLELDNHFCNTSVAPGNTPPYFRSVVAAKKPSIHPIKIMKAKMTAGKWTGSKLNFTYTTNLFRVNRDNCHNCSRLWASSQAVGSEYHCSLEWRIGDWGLLGHTK